MTENNKKAPSKEKKLTPFDYINSINNKTGMLNTKDYNAFIVNRGFSYFNDTIQQAEILNENFKLPTDMQYRLLYEMITQRKRYAKWVNSNEVEDIPRYNKIIKIQIHYQCSELKAIDMVDIVPDEELQYLDKYLI
jgi:hypothetical protein